MDKIQIIILISLVFISVIAWIFSINQPDMMEAMMILNPIAVSIFTVSWTIGMMAMMFPAIIPMIFLYNRLISGSNSDTSISYDTDSRFSISKQTIDDSEKKGKVRFSLVFLVSINSIKTASFIGAYLLVWALTGILLLVLWSVLMNNLFVRFETTDLNIVSGLLLVISGVYQFSSLKRKCLGYCESPLAFFMKRWKGNKITSALKMGIYHGFYCLGCCWPYFLLMVALGWMNVLWMGLFAGIIFVEKIWSKGILISRTTGIGFIVVGLLLVTGIISLTTLEESEIMHSEDMVETMIMN